MPSREVGGTFTQTLELLYYSVIRVRDLPPTQRDVTAQNMPR